MDDILINGTSLGICDWTAEGTPLGDEDQEPFPKDGGRGRKCMFTPDSGTSHLNMPTFAFASLMEATESWDNKPC